MVQRVSHARVSVAGETTGRIGPGLLALIGVARSDGPPEARALAEKIVYLRVFPDSEDRMNRSLLDCGGELCVVSQFTLMGDCRKGRRPSWNDAAPPEAAEPLVEAVVAAAREFGVRVASGRFRAKMAVELCNDGPVTLLLDTERRF